jgi:hypothetical protein
MAWAGASTSPCEEPAAPMVVGRGPVRTGVTVVHTRGRSDPDPVFGAWFTLNGERSTLAPGPQLALQPGALARGQPIGVLEPPQALIAVDLQGVDAGMPQDDRAIGGGVNQERLLANDAQPPQDGPLAYSVAMQSISTSELPGMPPAAAIVVRTGGSGPKRPRNISFIPA